MRNLLTLALPLLVAACGGSDEPAGTPATGTVTAKAVADVDGAMADAQRSRTAPPATAAATRQ